MTSVLIELTEGFALEPAPFLDWTLFDDTGRNLNSARTRIEDIPKADHVELIIPAATVLLTEVSVPPGNRQKLHQLLPYAVEEKVMADPETLHVIGGPRYADGKVPVAIVDRAWLQAALDRLNSHDIQPRAAVAETLLPPLQPDAWTAVWRGGSGFARTGAYGGFAFDGGTTDEPPLALKLALTEAAQASIAPSAIVLRLQGIVDAPDLDRWSAALGLTVTLGQTWNSLQQNAREAPPLNLLQGLFSPASFRTEGWPRLRPALWIAAAMLVLQLGAMGTDWLLLKQEKRRLESSMTDQFRAAFPEAKAIVDPRRQMEANLTELRGLAGTPSTSDLVPMLARVALRLDRAIQVATLKYRRGTLELELRLPANVSAETVREQLQAAGFSVQLQRVQSVLGGSIAQYALQAAA